MAPGSVYTQPPITDAESPMLKFGGLRLNDVNCKLIKKVHCVSNLASVKTNGLVICFTSTDVLFGMARMAQHLTQQRSQEVACLDLTQQEAWEMAQCSLIF